LERGGGIRDAILCGKRIMITDVLEFKNASSIGLTNIERYGEIKEKIEGIIWEHISLNVHNDTLWREEG
jgi:hypothetical protein